MSFVSRAGAFIKLFATSFQTCANRTRLELHQIFTGEAPLSAASTLLARVVVDSCTGRDCISTVRCTLLVIYYICSCRFQRVAPSSTSRPGRGCGCQSPSSSRRRRHPFVLVVVPSSWLCCGRNRRLVPISSSSSSPSPPVVATSPSLSSRHYRHLLVVYVSSAWSLSSPRPRCRSLVVVALRPWPWSRLRCVVIVPIVSPRRGRILAVDVVASLSSMRRRRGNRHPLVLVVAPSSWLLRHGLVIAVHLSLSPPRCVVRCAD